MGKVPDGWEESMDYYYFSAELQDGRMLCLSQMTDRRLAMSGQAIDDVSGYFLYELHGKHDTAPVEIIARVPTEEAAFRLREMLNLS
jgi:hypothetical protein